MKVETNLTLAGSGIVYSLPGPEAPCPPAENELRSAAVPPPVLSLLESHDLDMDWEPREPSFAMEVNYYSSPRVIMPAAVRGYQACKAFADRSLPELSEAMQQARVFSMSVREANDASLEANEAHRAFMKRHPGLFVGGPTAAQAQQVADFSFAEVGGAAPEAKLPDLPFPTTFIGFRGRTDNEFLAPSPWQIAAWERDGLWSLPAGEFPGVVSNTYSTCVAGVLLQPDRAYLWVTSVNPRGDVVCAWHACSNVYGPAHGVDLTTGSDRFDGWKLRTITGPFIRRLCARLGTSKRTEVSSFARRDAMRRGRGGILPKEFYEVRYEGVFQPAKCAKDLLAEVRRLAYRHDRRAHGKARIRRGTLPLPAELAAKLEKYGYTICVDEVPMEIEVILADRALPTKGDNEWLAVKQWRVRNTVVGPEDLPYRPALRVAP